MKIRKLWLLGAVLGVVAVQPAAQAGGPHVGDVAAVTLGTKYDLPCKLAAGDVVKTHMVTNNTGKTIKKDTVINYSNSDGDKGKITLNADVATGKDIEISPPGKTGGGTCNAWFSESADFKFMNVEWITENGQSMAAVTLKNISDFQIASASTTKVDRYQCVSKLLETKTIATPAIPIGGTVVVKVAMAKGANQYLAATANATGFVPEKYKANNAGISAEGQSASCIPH